MFITILFRSYNFLIIALWKEVSMAFFLQFSFTLQEAELILFLLKFSPIIKTSHLVEREFKKMNNWSSASRLKVRWGMHLDFGEKIVYICIELTRYISKPMMLNLNFGYIFSPIHFFNHPFHHTFCFNLTTYAVVGGIVGACILPLPLSILFTTHFGSFSAKIVMCRLVTSLCGGGWHMISADTGVWVEVWRCDGS